MIDEVNTIEKKLLKVLQNDYGGHTFEDFLKVVIAKFYDEKFNLSQFETTAKDPPEFVKERILAMLSEATVKLKLYPDIISENKAVISMNPSLVKELVAILQEIKLSEFLLHCDLLGDIYIALT